MANVKISQLPAGTPALDSVLCADNAAGTVTEKYTIADVLALDANASGNKVSSDTTNITGANQINNIVQISQTDYDALGTYDQNTIYFIV